MPKREVQDFISHWSAASPSERANSQPFLIELCDLLDVPRPDPHPDNGYFFEFPVVEHHPDGTTSNGRIDLYRRAHFVLESKQFQEAKARASQLELAAEEAGVIHWLRPDYQAIGQAEMILPADPGQPVKKAKTKPAAPVRATKSAWPKKMAERVQAVEAALHRHGTATPAELAGQFKRAQPADVAEILETLVTIGRARQQGEKFSR